MELVDMRVLGTRAFGVSVRVRPGAIIKLRLLLALRETFGFASRAREVRDHEKRKKIEGEIRK